MPVPAQQVTSVSKHRHPRGSKGSGILELLVVLAITIALAVISFPIYQNYIDKAKITIALGTLENIRSELKTYHDEYQEYPPEPKGSFLKDFFFTGKDSKGRTVFQSLMIEQISDDLSSVSYNTIKGSYTIIAKARDSKQTTMTVTSKKISY